jgi:hypothetical protein
MPLPVPQNLNRDAVEDLKRATAVGWIHIGRDTSLEQRILVQIRDRVAGV